MKIADFLSPTDVIVDAVCADKNQALRQLAERASAALGIPANPIQTALRAREDLGSTGTGGGVAIPHARVDFVQKPYGVLMKLNRSIDFDSMDGKPVDIVFMLLLPKTPEGDQLGVLAAVSRTLRSAPVVRKMREATTSSELSEIASSQS
ncbi:PTS sugar transporter subunit IIA [Pseudorhodoplanes sinuspersici]|uniref:PTS sugar transporter subunit IIA n=1 Tax=Pseudorhodoplanes sinuspersici TaxID=1235591 RepID=A0A1W6ZYN3_9HYPH|nr:PTS sugar transporter subunit IIA [Pseudorhodoplanes sinuspersici]ARQ02443.1 PTS sugar transporter subunit IIA [Pseudorhodoplanes sinuspersici]RKE74279.1 phosphotransferase IIA-like nitrogen-regulatory protein PtsN [Pseudorhodoplanes sinuspersici]